MRKMTSLAAVAVLLCAGSALAGDPVKCGGAAKGNKACCGKSGQKAAGEACCRFAGLDPAAAKILAGLPQLTYRVGDLETCCLETAKKKAGEQGKIEYLAAGKSYDCKRQASAELASLLEEQLETMMTVKSVVDGEPMHCATMAKQAAEKKGTKVLHRLAGFDFESKDKADAAAKAVREAVARLAKSQGIDKAPAGAGSTASVDISVAGVATRGCGSMAAKLAAGAKGGCCPKGKAVAGGAKGGCGAKAATVAGDAKRGCGSKSATAAAGAKGCCPKGGGDCPNTNAEAHLAKVNEILRVMVETVAKTRTS